MTAEKNERKKAERKQPGFDPGKSISKTNIKCVASKHALIPAANLNFARPQGDEV